MNQCRGGWRRSWRRRRVIQNTRDIRDVEVLNLHWSSHNKSTFFQSVPFFFGVNSKTIMGVYPWHCHRSVLRFQYFDTQSGKWRGKRKDNIPKYVAQDVSESYKNVSEGRDAVLMIGKKSKTIFDFWLMLEKQGFQFSLAKVAILWSLWARCWH